MNAPTVQPPLGDRAAAGNWSLGCLAAMMLLLLGCPQVKELEIPPFKKAVHGEGVLLCLDAPGCGCGIESLEYRWGYEHHVRVVVEQVLDPPADGSSVKCSLVELLDEREAPAGTKFDLIGQAGPPNFEEVVQHADDGWRLSDGEPFAGADEIVNAQISDLLGQDRGLIISFEFPEGGSGGLVASAITAFD